ncbi:hypothetical protein BU16DRAFT_371158 [Lophium mytilinum]|uniref:Uncharacterized protein n=1 Tax=Lophium mytilinum TaxID=390894 RepID=A0A6A6QX53_9PEZI|nr:hypothetical protein BU16DRAFT_371158 [Lophium mytilinum]
MTASQLRGPASRSRSCNLPTRAVGRRMASLVPPAVVGRVRGSILQAKHRRVAAGLRRQYQTWGYANSNWRHPQTTSPCATLQHQPCAVLSCQNPLAMRDSRGSVAGVHFALHGADPTPKPPPISNAPPNFAVGAASASYPCWALPYKTADPDAESFRTCLPCGLVRSHQNRLNGPAALSRPTGSPPFS